MVPSIVFRLCLHGSRLWSVSKHDDAERDEEGGKGYVPVVF